MVITEIGGKTMFIPPATVWIHSGNPQVFCWGNVCMDQKSSNIDIVILLCTIHGWIFYKVIDPLSGPKNVRVTILMTIIIILILHLYLVGIDDIGWSSFLCWWFHFIILSYSYDSMNSNKNTKIFPDHSIRFLHHRHFFHKITVTSR